MTINSETIRVPVVEQLETCLHNVETCAMTCQHPAVKKLWELENHATKAELEHVNFSKRVDAWTESTYHVKLRKR